MLSYFTLNECSLINLFGSLALIYGLIYLTTFAFRFLRFIYQVKIRPGKDLLSRYGKSWAVVTGSTAGIGYEFAVQLAKKGFNIILVSRSESKLKQCMEQIQKITDNKVEVTYVVADFQKDSSIEYYENIAKQITIYDIGLLVVNAGVMPIGTFADANPVELKAMVDVNCMHHVLLTRFILPKMLLRQKKSGMIHTSSGAALGPLYGFTTYSATKVFDDYLARGLRHEVGDKVDVMSLRPFGTATELIQINDEEYNKKSQKRKITAGECVKSTLDSLGYDEYMYPEVSHKIQGFATEMLHYLNLSGPVSKKMYVEMKNATTNKSVE